MVWQVELFKNEMQCKCEINGYLIYCQLLGCNTMDEGAIYWLALHKMTQFIGSCDYLIIKVVLVK